MEAMVARMVRCGKEKVRSVVAKCLGGYYRNLRQKRSMTLESVAVGAGVSIATVHRAERSFSLRSAAHRRIANYLTGRRVA